MGEAENFALEIFASEYVRAQQTARILLDHMGLLSMGPRISPLLNERDYGTAYDRQLPADVPKTAAAITQAPAAPPPQPGLGRNALQAF